MKLSDEDRRAFQAGGFVVLRGLFTEAEVTPARAAFERLYATAQTLRATGDHDGAFFVVSPPPDPARAPVVVQRVVWAGGAEPALLRLSEDPRLVEPSLELLAPEDASSSSARPTSRCRTTGSRSTGTRTSGASRQGRR